DDVHALAREEAIRLDPEGDEQVSPSASRRSGFTLPGQPKLRPRVDASGNGDLELPLRPDLPLSLAGRAGSGRDGTPAIARRARSRDREAALPECNHTGSLALRARRGRGARRRTVP